MNVHQEIKRGRGRPKGIPNSTRKNYHADPKYCRVRELYLSGKNYEEVGEALGVSRQRIEQMIRKLDLVPSRQRLHDTMAVVTGTIVRKSLTISEACEMFNMPRSNVFLYCKKMGVTPPRMTAEEVAELEAMVDQVKTGKSLNSVAEGTHHRAEKLRRFMVKKGETARGRSRWDDFTERKAILREMIPAGATWRQCIEKINQTDPRKILPAALEAWARRNMPELFGAPSKAKQAEPTS